MMIKSKQNLKHLLILSLIIGFIYSCKQKPDPSLSEDSLSEIINADSIVYTEAIETFDFSPDTTKIHLKQIESKRAGSPPQIIDLTKDPKTIKDITLSDIASHIEYIKFKPTDTTYFHHFSTQFQFYKDYIISSNLKATLAFDKYGNQIDYIVKNVIDYENVGNNVSFNSHTFGGVWTTPVIKNDKLYYLYRDPGSSYFMERSALCAFDLDELGKIHNPIDMELETPAKGVPLMSVKGGFNFGIENLQVLDDNTWIGSNSVWETFTSRKLMHSFSMDGDTLTSFDIRDKSFGHSGGNYRNAEDNYMYKLKEKIMYRPAYSDTIYQIFASNRMMPKYALHRGDKGMTAREGLSPRISLEGKIVIDQLIETNNRLLLVTCNNHNCPNTRRAGKVQFSLWLYNKTSQQVIKAPEGFFEYNSGLLNDIDNGMKFWPSQVTEQGCLLNGYSVKLLKQHFSIEELKSKFPYEEFNDDEYILMIVK